MFLEISENKKYTYLYKTTYITVAKNKYKKSRELIGRLDMLEKSYPDPITYFRAKIEKENEILAKQKESSKVSIAFDTSETISNLDIINGAYVDEALQKNVGSLLFQTLFYRLGFDKLLKKIQIKENSKIKLHQVFQLLIICRCLFPNSKLSDFKRKDTLADNFNISRDDIYRGLELLNKYKKEIISHLNNNIHKLCSYDLMYTHYDLTNYFVYTDDTTLLIKKGYSKVKNGKPIIQQALLADGNGIPINYKLFSGNRSDVSTLVDFLKEQKKFFKIKNTTIIADAGLVSNTNIKEILLSGNHYIFKESLLRVNKNIMATFENVVKPKLENIMENNPNLKGCYFSVVLDISVTVVDINGVTKKVKIPQKYIFTYSKKFDEALTKVRYEQLEDAEKYLKNSSSLKKSFKNFLPNLIEIDTSNAEVDLDYEKLNKYEATSGYSLIITSKLKTNDKDIIMQYKNQYLIEESFRILKTDLDIDNIYLKRDERIEGHFLIGFFALAFYRIMQKYLNNEYSVNKIKESLLNYNISKLRDTNYYQLGSKSLTIAKLEEALKVGITQKMFDGKELRVIIGNMKK